MPDDTASLVNQTYVQSIILRTEPGVYVGSALELSWPQTAWGLFKGSRGYWISENGRTCWQARNANGPLAFWNSDGAATGDPDDWESFVFHRAPSIHSYTNLVTISNILGKYVNRQGSRIACTAGFYG